MLRLKEVHHGLAKIVDESLVFRVNVVSDMLQEHRELHDFCLTKLGDSFHLGDRIGD